MFSVNLPKPPTHNLYTAAKRYPQRQDREKARNAEADHLYTLLKPLHNLPRGKNTWDPSFIKIWWFWPAGVVFLLVLYNVYPYICNLFGGS